MFTVSANGDLGIAGFSYAFDNQSVAVPSTTDCSYLNDGGLGTSVAGTGLGNSSGELALDQGSAAQIMAPPGLTPGRHTLYVVAFDHAHNPSPVATYVFYVAPNYQGGTTSPIPASTLPVSGENASLVSDQAGSCCGLTSWPADQVLFSATAAGQSFILSFSVGTAGTYQLGAYMTRSTHYGEAEVELDQIPPSPSGASGGTPLGGTGTVPFDGYAPRTTNAYLDLGTQSLRAGTHTLTFTVAGQDANSVGYQIGVVYLTLGPTNRYQADSLVPRTAQGGTLGLPSCQAESSWADNCAVLFTNSTPPSPSATPPASNFTVTFTAPVESDYALGVNLVTGSDYGMDEFEVDPVTSQDPTGPDIILDNSSPSGITDPSRTVACAGHRRGFLSPTEGNGGITCGTTRRAASRWCMTPGTRRLRTARAQRATRKICPVFCPACFLGA